MSLIAPTSQPPVVHPLPPEWREIVSSALKLGESIVSFIEVDLDTQRQFSEGLLLLTTERLIAWEHGQQISDVSRDRLRGLDLGEHGSLVVLIVRLKDQSALNFRRPPRAASEPVDFIEQVDESLAGKVLDHLADFGICRRCGGQLLPDGKTCPDCDELQYPAAKSMLRLLPFAKPWLGYSILGVVLTVLSTAAALVWPHLTGNLVDDLKNDDPDLLSKVIRSLIGLALASMAACLLGWGRRYVLAWVSERIAPICATHVRPSCSVCRWSSSAASGPAT